MGLGWEEDCRLLLYTLAELVLHHRLQVARYPVRLTRTERFRSAVVPIAGVPNGSTNLVQTRSCPK